MEAVISDLTPVTIGTQCVCDDWVRIYDKADKASMLGKERMPVFGAIPVIFRM